MSSKNPHFKLVAIEDQVIVKFLPVRDNIQKRAEDSNIVLTDGAGDPKNIMEMERKAAQDAAKYEEAEEKLKQRWSQHPNQAIVVAVGPGKWINSEERIPIDVKVGQRIYIRGRTGEPVIYKKEVYFVIRSYDIYCVDPEPFKAD